MTERRASLTALGVAAHRAAHQILDDEPKILDDPIAERLLDAGAIERIKSGQSGAEKPAPTALRSHVVLRSRFSEDRLAEAARRGVRQCVILGAGYDTFAYRQPDWARDLRIFEVDQPATQADKRQRLQAAGVATPENLEYVAIDFEQMSLAEGLRSSSLDSSQPAFFSCLGVLVYLTQEAIDAIFALVAGFPKGSEIAFTFSSPESATTEMAARVGRGGEPWLSHTTAQALTHDLGAKGFSEISFLDAENAERAYRFAGRSDGLPPPRRTSIAVAVR
jgi:methyltransferase (TIGR00027 family)